MATASEGKTMDSSPAVCGSCKVNIPIQCCEECEIRLCSMCSNIHKNIPFTKDHTISDLELPDEGTQPQPSPATCSKHQGQGLTYLCKDCVQLLCDLCKDDHTGHEFLPLSDDPKVYHKVCGKHIQKLIEELHGVEEMKAVLEGHICTFGEALGVVDTWEIDLLKMVTDKANKLREKIKKMKDEKIKLLEGKDGVITKLQEIDKSISKLHDIRKSIDTEVLANELFKSQELINKLELYKSEMQPLPAAPKVDEALSHGDKMAGVGDDLDILFSIKDINVTSQTNGPKAVAEWRFTAVNKGRDLSPYQENDVTMTNIKYGRGPNGERDGAAVLPASENESMIVFQPSARLRFNTEMTYYSHVFIQGTQEGYLFAYNPGTGNNSPGIDGTRVRVYDDCTSLGVYGNGSDVISVPNIFTRNTWYKVAITFDASSICVYIGSNLVHRDMGNFKLDKSHQGHIHMGYRPRFSLKLQGRIAVAKFFDVALSEEEIRKLD